MSDDIEALRNICNQVMDDEPRKQAIAALERVEKRIDALHKSQGYVYIGKDGKAISARELEADRDSLRIALDDRYAADQRAAKAIFAATGRTSGFPSVKEVVGFYMAEADRLEKERDWFKGLVNSHDLLKDNADLRAKLEKAKEALLAWQKWWELPWEAKRPDVAQLRYDRAHIVLSELSADAPAQPRVRHKKRGSTYRVLGRGELQSSSPIEEGAMLVVYRCETDGRLWVRPAVEFDDGRFETLSDAPAQQTQISDTVREAMIEAVKAWKARTNDEAVREAMAEAEKALEPIAAEYHTTHTFLPSLSNGHVKVSLTVPVAVLRDADAAIAKLRSARDGD